MDRGRDGICGGDWRDRAFVIPPGEAVNKFIFEVKLVGGTGSAILLGIVLVFSRGASRRRARPARPASCLTGRCGN